MNLLRHPRFVRALRSATTLVLMVGIGWLVWPAALGGQVSYLMVSGTSMEPGMHTGDLAVVRERTDYEIGDIVGFRVPEGEVGAGSIVIHRIVGGDPVTGFETQGDNRPRSDVWRPTAGDVVGERVVLVPGVGTWVARLRNPLPLAYLAGAMTLVAMLLPTRRDRERRRAVDAAVAPAPALPKASKPKLRLVPAPPT
jgi:signal peptidase I